MHPTGEDLLDLAVTALGGRRREGQRAMVRAVEDAIERGEHVLVQAGTGTGKSLGYLVPVVRHAVAGGERVVVSTATLALQRQVMTRDLPLVAAAVAPRLDRPPQIALLKGWHNYLCRNKLAGGFPDDPLFDVPGGGADDHPGPAGAGDLGAQVLRVREWADQTVTGDRDDLVPGVTDRAWRQVSVTAMECLGRACPFVAECFPEQARARAHEADVVVTNHAMLGIAASGSPGVLPEHAVLVVDEAHELTERVTAQATVELSAASVQHAARLARRHGGVPGPELEAAASGLGTALEALGDGRLAAGLPEAVASAVAAVRDSARTVLSAMRPAEPSGPGGEGGRKMALSAVLAVFEVADRMVSDAVTTGRDVLWCARSDRSGEVRLHAAPLAVDALIRDQLFAGRTAVLTSATLTLGGTFEVLARSVGLDPRRQLTDDASTDGEGTGQPWRGIDVGTPFDYARNAILYVARHLPPPGREPATPAQLDEIAELVTAAGGATLGLFSSRRAATEAATAMRERLDVPVLCQGDDQVGALVRRFADDDATCLFGTLSLWQGVDVPGRACRLVLIDRIPFPRPDDPIRSARADAVGAAGGNGFMAVSATHAALLLAQGSGRLIRSDTDRGVVAVLDPRLVTARYGTFLVRSMPPFWRTTDRAAVLAALRRLAAHTGEEDVPDAAGPADEAMPST